MLTTLADLKANYLNIDVYDTDRDATITQCIAEASAVLKTLCNQPLAEEQTDFYFSGETRNTSIATQLLGGSGYATKTIPYTVPCTLVGLYRRMLPSDSWTAEPGAVVYVSDLQSQIYCSAGFGYTLYKAVLNLGYATIPDDLIHAASELAVYIYNETNVSNESRAGLASKTITQNNITTTRTYLDIIQRLRPIITKYTRYAI